MAELSGDLQKRILKFSAQGDELGKLRRFEEAISKYNQAWELVPEPKSDWNASTWLLAAIGNAAFQGGWYESAREALEFAMHCPDAIGNPFLHLRLGQALFEKGELDRSADELMRAYMGAGDEIFAAEDPKYRAFLATRAQLQ